MRSRFLPVLLLSSLCAAPLWSQHTATTVTQNVGQRGTVSELSASPTTGLVVGSTVGFTVLLDTAGAPAVTTESITFKDGATVIGTGPLSDVNITNLLPFSYDFTQWTPVAVGAAAPTLTASTAAAPDGSTPATRGASLNIPLTMVFPVTPGSAQSGVTLQVPGTAYAGQSLTFSVWLQASAATTVTLQITDSPASTASQTQQCNVGTAWSRCVFTFAMPSNAGTGFGASILETNAPAQSINVWGAQMEQASTAGPFVQTVGTAQSRQGGTATFSTSSLTDGSHTITAAYGGDANFVSSLSNAVVLNVGKGAATIALTEDSATTIYGALTTFTATLSGPVDTPTGTVAFMDGGTQIGTGTISGGVATFQTAALTPGSHSITAVYSGDGEFNTVTSTAVTHTVTIANASIAVTSTENPSTYGDSITLTITMTGSGVTPTGSVTLMDGATNLGTVPLNASGVATFSSSTLTAGAHNVTVTYSGDSNYN
jgi:Bacterial Ig-like domain (group 3)